MTWRTPATILLAALLAGCSGSPDPVDADPDTPGVQTGDEVVPFVAQAPSWQVGQWWDHEWSLGELGDSGTFTVKSIVAANASGDYTLATDSVDTAAQHAAFFFNDLGVRGDDWTMRSDDYTFPWYEFPLSDNKTWTATEANLDFDLQPVTRQLTLTSTLMGSGAGAHFMIEMREGDALRARYDYQPDLGWFSEFQAFPMLEGDEQAPQAPDEPTPIYTITTTSSGVGFSGTAYTSSGDFLLEHFSHMATPDPMQPQAPPMPAPQATFLISGDHTHVLAIPFSFAAAGVHNVEIVAPDGQHWEAAVVADHQGTNVFTTGPPDGLLLVDAVPGSWQVTFTGAGAFVAGGGIYAWGLTIAEVTV